MKETILLEHGGGGLLSSELVNRVFLPAFDNPLLKKLGDSAVFEQAGGRLCFTTDSYVVSPIFFPGGDIGSLAVHGTVNDLAVSGGKPLFLSAGFILEEGFLVSDLHKIVQSMSRAALNCGVRIVTGDTKVVPRGAADGIFINTSGIGIIDYPGTLSASSIESGDAIIVNGTIGDHGSAIMSSREGFEQVPGVVSDSAPLNGLVKNILGASSRVHFMRDATRGGLGAVLAEAAGQSGFEIEVWENKIPVKNEVRGICEVLGLDPMFLANEGKLVVFCAAKDAMNVLDAMCAHEFGHASSIIGTAGAQGPGRLLLHTLVGGTRVLDLPSGELVPRIC